MCFLVPSSCHRRKQHRLAWDVAFLLQQPGELAGVPHGSGAFVGSGVDVQPAGWGSVSLHIVDQRPVSKPQRRAHGARESERFWRAEERVQTDQTAHRRAEDARGLTLGPRPDAPIDERFERALDEREIGVASAAAMSSIRERAVLAHALGAPVRNADHDRLEPALRKIPQALLEPPGSCERTLRVRKILSVLHVDRRIASSGVRVGGRQEDVDVALVLELRRPDPREHAPRDAGG